MASVNKVIIMGNLGADPELRYTAGGQAVCDLRIATSRRYKDKGGETQEETEWHRVVVWGKQAESCKEYLAKGRSVYIEGRIQTRSWEDRDGNKRWTTEILAQTVQFVGGARGQGGNSEGGGGAGSAKGSKVSPPVDDSDNGPDFGDDDIPF